MKKIVLFLVLSLLAGCFESSYKITITTDKNLESLLPEEAFSLTIDKIEGVENTVTVAINGVEKITDFGKKEIYYAPKNNTVMQIKASGRVIKEIPLNIYKEKADVAVFAYICADNNMSNNSLIDIEEMRKGTISNAAIKVFAFIDRKDEDFNSFYLLISNGQTRILSKTEEKNTGDEKTLKDFIDYGKQCLEGKKNICIIWNHGDGWYGDDWEKTTKRAIGFDDTSDDALNLFELENGLKELGTKWDMVIMDACLMNGIEVLYQLKDCCKYILGSPEEVPFDGFLYSDLFDVLAKKTETLEAGKNIIDNTINYYENNQDMALYSLLDTTQAQILIDRVESLAMELVEEKKDYKTVFENELLTYSQVSDDYTKNTEYADLLDFVNIVSADPLMDGATPSAKIQSCNAVKEVLNQIVVYNKFTSGYTDLKMNKSGGLSIYLPLQKYNSSYEKFTKMKTNWTSYIKSLN